jgi:hypothetical protein
MITSRSNRTNRRMGEAPQWARSVEGEENEGAKSSLTLARPSDLPSRVGAQMFVPNGRELVVEELIVESRRRGRRVVQHDHTPDTSPVVNPFCLCPACCEAWLQVFGLEAVR